MKFLLPLLILSLVLTLTLSKDRRLQQPQHHRRQLKQLKKQQQQQQQQQQQNHQPPPTQHPNEHHNPPPLQPPPPQNQKPSQKLKKLSPEHINDFRYGPGQYAKFFQLERKSPSSKNGKSEKTTKNKSGTLTKSRDIDNNVDFSSTSKRNPKQRTKSQEDMHPKFNENHQQLTPDELARSFLQNAENAKLLNLGPSDLTTQRNDFMGNGNVKNDKGLIGMLRNDKSNDNNNDNDDDNNKNLDRRNKANRGGGGGRGGGVNDDVEDNDDDDDDGGDGNEDTRKNDGWGSQGQSSPNNKSFETLFGKHFGGHDNGQWFSGPVEAVAVDGDVSTSGYLSFLDLGNAVQRVDCPEGCHCENTAMDCSGQNFTSVPKGINPMTTLLDLSMNNIQKLPEDSFAHLLRLEQLNCVGNKLTKLPRKLFKHNTLLRVLNFRGNQLQKVPPRAFQNLQYLLELQLDDNAIHTIPKNAFRGLFRLQQLRLDANQLDHFPSEAMKELTGLQAVTLAVNNITKIPAFGFQNNTRLIHILLSSNEIEEIEDNAFFGLSKLKYLQLDRNKIRQMPTSFSHLTNLEELNLAKNRLSHLPDMSFQFKDRLSVLGLRNNPIKSIGDKVFSHLPSLTELVLSEVHDLTRFPDLTGTISLEKLQLDRANIKSLPKDLCRHLTNLTSFDVHSNKIGTIPNMSLCVHLSNLNMANNELTSLDGQLFKGLSNLHDLTLSNNFIHTIPANAFIGLSSLEYLNLAENQISFIHPDAFIPLKSLTDLNLGENHISNLPTAGLTKLQKLKVFHNKELREFPPKEAFPNINHFVLAYAYHCCDFIRSRPEQNAQILLRENIIWMGGYRVPGTGHTNRTIPWPLFSSRQDSSDQNMTVDKNHDVIMQIINEQDEFEFPQDGSQAAYYPDGYNYEMISMLHENGSEFGDTSYDDGIYDHEVLLPQASISCRPKPGPFMPCDDLFGWWSLRCGVWIVFLLALLGNFVVFFVSVTSRSKMDVPRFLICNLALADFFMGIYLGILAIVDASTLGQFKKYAIQWQMSPGCLVAGFLGVFSSELSVFTLTVITLERFYAITHAMQLNKRLSLKHSSVIMLGGWIFCFGIATMPLFGISDYRKFAICLPFEIEDIFSKGYVCFIMTFNGIAFFIILSCYLIMYISIRDSQAWNSNETRVAKRMALLVFTDFMCWAPIAFLSLAAAFGKHLIHLNEAKVLTIFILPLNSCANPFLYAFFTKQFKRDCVLFCRRLEDSSIARHFSQVSQRHVSASWKCQHRQSGLNSLMGDGKSQSQNNSHGSNSYGLVNNYHSDVSSGTNKDANVKDTWSKDVKSNFRSAPSTKTNGVPNGKSAGGEWNSDYKYSPCPKDNADDGVRPSNSCGVHANGRVRGVGDAQVTLHINNDDKKLPKSNRGGDSNNNSNQQRSDTKPRHHHHHLNNISTNAKFCKRPPALSYKTADEEVGIISDEESSVWKKMSTKSDENDLKDNVSDVTRLPKHQAISLIRPKLGSVDSYYSVERPKHSPQRNAVQNQHSNSLRENTVKCFDNIANHHSHGSTHHKGKHVTENNGKANRPVTSTTPVSSTRSAQVHAPLPGTTSGSEGLRKSNKKEKQNLRQNIPAHAVSTKHRRRKNIQCCSANTSPVDNSGYEFVKEQKRKKIQKKVDGKSRKTPVIQYVMTMPDDPHTSKTDVESNKLDMMNSQDLTDKVEQLLPPNCVQKTRVKVNNVQSCDKIEDGGYVCKDRAHSQRDVDRKADVVEITAGNSEKCRHKDVLISNTHHKNEALRPPKGLVKTTSAPPDAIPIVNGFPVPTREFLHHHTAIDKSVHLRYFQQSIAGHEFICRSNSLVELTESQLEDAKIRSMPAGSKRGSLSPKHDAYILLSEETGGSLVKSYHHHHCRQRSQHYCNYRQYSSGEASDDVCSCFFTPDVTMDAYGAEQTSDSLEECYHSNTTPDITEGLSFRNMSSADWKQTKQEELGGLLADSDTDDFEGKHDSLSSAKHSADKESGFHSQI